MDAIATLTSLRESAISQHSGMSRKRHALARIFPFFVALLGIALGRGASADIVILHGLLCAEPSAVNRAVPIDDLRELARLGCTLQKPYSLGFRALRCEPQGMEVSPKSFSHPIRRDETLPYDVCEVEAIMPDGQVVTAYTGYFLIIPWSRMRLTLPRYEGPQVR